MTHVSIYLAVALVLLFFFFGRVKFIARLKNKPYGFIIPLLGTIFFAVYIFITPDRWYYLLAASLLFLVMTIWDFKKARAIKAGK